MFILILDSVEDFHTVEVRRLHRIFCGLCKDIKWLRERFLPSEPFFIVKRTCRYCCLWMSWAFPVLLSILRILAVLLRFDSTPWCLAGVCERCFRWYAAECWCYWWVFYVYPRVPPSYAGGWIWRCLRCLWRLCSAILLSFWEMKNRLRVSSKCLSVSACLSCLRLHNYYSKKTCDLSSLLRNRSRVPK